MSVHSGPTRTYHNIGFVRSGLINQYVPSDVETVVNATVNIYESLLSTEIVLAL